MLLSIPERLKLLELMPEKASYAGIMEIHRTTMLLSLTGEEAEEIEAKPMGEGRITWNQEKALTMNKDIPMGEWMTEVFRGILREKDRNDDLSRAEISLFEKLILDYE